jgi:hypothetical protein
MHPGFLIAGLLFSLPGTHAPRQEADQNGRTGIVFVVSRAAVDAIVQDEFEITIPIRRDVQAYPVTGEALGRGVSQIQFVPSSNSGRFAIVVNGSVDAHFSSTIGPATLHASTSATFRSRMQIEFNGNDFFALPAETANCHRTTIDRIHHRGLALVFPGSDSEVSIVSSGSTGWDKSLDPALSVSGKSAGSAREKVTRFRIGGTIDQPTTESDRE